MRRKDSLEALSSLVMSAQIGPTQLFPGAPALGAPPAPCPVPAVPSHPGRRAGTAHL